MSDDDDESEDYFGIDNFSVGTSRGPKDELEKIKDILEPLAKQHSSIVTYRNYALYAKSFDMSTSSAYGKMLKFFTDLDSKF